VQSHAVLSGASNGSAELSSAFPDIGDRDADGLQIGSAGSGNEAEHDPLTGCQRRAAAGSVDCCGTGHLTAQGAVGAVGETHRIGGDVAASEGQDDVAGVIGFDLHEAGVAVVNAHEVGERRRLDDARPRGDRPGGDDPA